jgi:hypothetical protein
MCGCGIRGLKVGLHYCIGGKLLIFEDLKLIIGEKKRAEEEMWKAEEKLHEEKKKSDGGTNDEGKGTKEGN